MTGSAVVSTSAGTTASPRYDLRLAMLAAGVWPGTWLAARWPVTVSVVLVVVVAVGFRRLDRHRPIMAVWVLGLTAGIVVTVGQVAVIDAVRDLPVMSTPVTVEMTLTGDPRQLRGKAEPTFVVPVRVESIGLGDSTDAATSTWRTSVDAVVFAVDRDPATGERQEADSARWRDLLPGQRVRTTGRASPVTDHPGELSAMTISVRDPPQSPTDPPWWQTAAGVLRDGLRQACAELPPGPAGLLPGLVIGDVSRLPQEVDEDFRDTGMTHLVAVSGSNVAVVVGAVVLAAAALGAGPRVRVALGCVAIIGFVILARPEPSVLRAAVMGAVTLLAIGWGRRGSAIPSVSAAVVILLLADPRLASSLGFALSVTATLGLVLLAHRWSSAWRSSGWPGWLTAAIAVALAAQVAVTPLLAAWEGRISLVAVPANVLAAPAVPIATILGLLCCVVAPWWPEAGHLLAWLAGWPTRWLIEVAHHGAAVPVGDLPWPTGWLAGLVLALLLAVAVVLVKYRFGRIVVAIVLVCGLFAGLTPVRTMLTGWPPPGWIMVACDVGQGDAIVLSTGYRGSAVVIDAGPDPDLVDGCLRDLGVDRVPLLVITHFHADHVAGVAGIYRNREIGQVLVPHQMLPAGGVRQVAEAVGAPELPTTVVGSRYLAGRLELTVLAAGDAFTGTRSDPNNDSVVVLARIDGLRMLLAGDIEEPAQLALADSGVDLSAEVLKVPHHGSGYFEPRFIAAVDPAIAVISVGDGNEYGHPHPRVLAELSAVGAHILRTDRHGSVAVMATDSGLQLAYNG
ncbi:competence protein ComEC [Stackebrandtia endophytica]|uniref:Competence protein ComEC n=1 Tax=Stackebrandtia endophytica TaxID=1496996 RepID=A0A543B0M3_9ACTN|nr:ComEC/Rec2 family competence protein [Stackebrandtia endophytica]TQL78383.1 competence protein ComEC [Stackebrandtia endophytica]